MQTLFRRSYRYIALMSVIAFAFAMSVSAAPGDYISEFSENNPYGVAVDANGNIYAASGNGNVVNIYDSSGVSIGTIGTGVAGNANNQFAFPIAVDVDASGNIYVADRSNHRIQIFDSSYNYVATIGSNGTGNGQFADPSGVAVASNGNIVVSDTSNHRIQLFDSSYNFIASVGTVGTSGAANNQFFFPNGITFDASNNVYVADSNNNRVQVFNSALSYQTTIAANYPLDVAVDTLGDVYVLETGASQFTVYNSAFTLIASYGSAGAGNGQFNNASGITLTSNGLVIIGDRSNNRVQILEGQNFIASVGCYIDAPASADEGTTFTATVRCDGVADFYGFQFGTTPTGDGSTAATSYTVGEFDTNATNAVLGGSNTLNLFAQSHTGNDIASGDFTLGSYDLTADSYLTADGSVVITLDNFNASDINGAPLSVLATAPDATVIINDIILSQLTGDVTLASDGVVTALVDAILDIDGTSYGPNAGAGTTIAITVNQQSNVLSITVTADLESHLTCTSTVAIVDGTNDVATAIGTLTLAAGDVVTVSDNGINIQDATAIGAVFGGAPTAEEDVNKDGTVDVFDLVHVGRNYNAVSGTCN